MTSWPINKKYQSDGCSQLVLEHRAVSRDNLGVIPEMIGSVIDYHCVDQVLVRIKITGLGFLVTVVPDSEHRLTNIQQADQLTDYINTAVEQDNSHIFIFAQSDGTFGEHEITSVLDNLREVE